MGNHLQHVVPTLEVLESRRLFAISYSLAGQQLTVLATEGPDVITIRLRDANHVRLSVNGEVKIINYEQLNEFVIIALGGNDRIEFDDTLPILKGARVIAGTGKDTINGTHGRDLLSGNGSNDVIDGDFGSDKIYGDGGNDVLLGQNGNDTLEGGSGDDQLFGGIGRDYLNGASGEDDLDGGTGVDSLTGGSSNDDFANNTVASELVDFGSEDTAPNSLLA